MIVSSDHLSDRFSEGAQMKGRTEPGSLRFAVLGPVRAWRGDKLVGTGSPQQRALLAALLLRGGRTATAAELIDALWGENRRTRALAALRTYAFRLRKALGPRGRWSPTPAATRCGPPPTALDVTRRRAAGRRGAERALRAGRPGAGPRTARQRAGVVGRRAAGRAAGPVRRDPAQPAGGVAAGTARDPPGTRPGARRPRRGGLRADRAHRRAPAARAAARPADARALPQRAAGRGAGRLRRHPPAARRGAGRRSLRPS